MTTSLAPPRIMIQKPAGGPPVGRGIGQGFMGSFPRKLHALIEAAEEKGYSDIICWQPEGRSFKVLQPARFVAEILPFCFQQTKYKSFQRQLNIYGFYRIHHGMNRGGYGHRLFVRGMPELVKRVSREASSDKKSSGASTTTSSLLSYATPTLPVPSLSAPRAMTPSPPLQLPSSNHDEPRINLNGNMTGDVDNSCERDQREEVVALPPEVVDEDDKSSLRKIEEKHEVFWSHPRPHQNLPAITTSDAFSRKVFHPVSLTPEFLQGIQNAAFNNTDSKLSTATPGGTATSSCGIDFKKKDTKLSMDEQPKEPSSVESLIEHTSREQPRRNHPASLLPAGGGGETGDPPVELGGWQQEYHHHVPTPAISTTTTCTCSDEVPYDAPFPSMTLPPPVSVEGYATDEEELFHFLEEAMPLPTPAIVEPSIGSVETSTEDGQERSGGHSSSWGPSGGFTFPFKLHRVLQEAESDNGKWLHIISWVEEGTGFRVHHVDGFVKEIMPIFFDQTKYESFRRQLNLYCFKRVSRGSRRGIYYHPSFLQRAPSRCSEITRVKSSRPRKGG